MENVEGIANVIAESDDHLNNEQGILYKLSDIRRKLLEFDSFKELYERIESVIIELNDVSSEFSILNNNLDLDSDELFSLQNRLDRICY